MTSTEEADFKYIFLVTGYNCAKWVKKCIKSILKQDKNNWHCFLGDDGSSDQTFSLMSKYQDDPRFTVYRNPVNLGACYLRWKGVRLLAEAHLIQDQDVILLIGADDWLSGPIALNILDKYYQAGAEVTYGNWKSYPEGRRPKIKHFPQEVLDNQSYRKYKWISTAINGFRYRLFRQIDPKDFQDPNGKWLKNCTDLAVMFPVLELADPKKIKAVRNVIYVYNHNYAHNTIRRFGSKDKMKVNKYIRSLTPYDRRTKIENKLENLRKLTKIQI